MDSLLSLKTENGASQDQHPAHRPHLRRPSLHLRQAEQLPEAGESINLMIGSVAITIKQIGSNQNAQVPSLLLLTLVAVLDWTDDDTW